MTNIKTQLFSYYYDTHNKEDLTAYETLVAMLESQGLKCFDTWGGNSHYHPAYLKNPANIELETKHIFNDQWNTASTGDLPNYRVHDWAQDYPINFSKYIKKGHYIVQVPEMASVRENTVACGYCGKQRAKKGAPEFCNQCLGSEYLESKELYMLRLIPVSKNKRLPLTAEEKSVLLPEYKHAQLHGSCERDKVRITEKRASLEKDYKSAIAKAETEYKGFTWLMDNGIKTDNVIYYSHTNVFCFGWRGNHGIDKEFESELLDIISEFPFAYEIKRSSGV